MFMSVSFWNDNMTMIIVWSGKGDVCNGCTLNYIFAQIVFVKPSRYKNNSDRRSL